MITRFAVLGGGSARRDRDERCAVGRGVSLAGVQSARAQVPADPKMLPTLGGSSRGCCQRRRGAPVAPPAPVPVAPAADDAALDDGSRHPGRDHLSPPVDESNLPPVENPAAAPAPAPSGGAPAAPPAGSPQPLVINGRARPTGRLVKRRPSARVQASASEPPTSASSRGSASTRPASAGRPGIGRTPIGARTASGAPRRDGPRHRPGRGSPRGLHVSRPCNRMELNR